MDKVDSPIVLHLPNVALCPEDGKELKTYHTWTKHQVTLLWGRERVKEVRRYCPEHPHIKFGLDGKELLTDVGATYGYDVMLKTALLRFDVCFSIQQIQNLIHATIGYTIPARTLCDLSVKALNRIVAIHRESSPEIRGMINAQGGYLLHIDGTFEEEPPMLVILKDSISGCTLDAVMVSSESEANLRPVLERIKQEFGDSLAVIRDGGDGVRKAVDAVFPGVPQLECHYHVLKNVGKAMFEEIYAEAVSLIEKHKFVPFLSKLCKELSPIISDIQEKDRFCSQVLYGKELPQMPINQLIPLVTYAFAAGIIEILRSNEKRAYPFGLPYVEMYKFCKNLLPRVHDYIILLAEASKYNKQLCELENALRTLVQDKELSSRIGVIGLLMEVFHRIRTILRTKDDTNFQKYDPKWNQLIVDKTKNQLVNYLDRLTRSIASLSEDNTRRKRCEKVRKLSFPPSSRILRILREGNSPPEGEN